MLLLTFAADTPLRLRESVQGLVRTLRPNNLRVCQQQSDYLVGCRLPRIRVRYLQHIDAVTVLAAIARRDLKPGIRGKSHRSLHAVPFAFVTLKNIERLPDYKAPDTVNFGGNLCLRKGQSLLFVVASFEPNSRC